MTLARPLARVCTSVFWSVEKAREYLGQPDRVQLCPNCGLSQSLSRLIHGEAERFGKEAMGHIELPGVAQHCRSLLRDRPGC